MSVNTAVSIHIIKFEIPAQFMLHLSSHHQAEGSHILHEIYVAILQKQAERWDLCTLPCQKQKPQQNLKWLCMAIYLL